LARADDRAARHAPSIPAETLDWLTRNEDKLLAQLNELLAIPSVSTQREHRGDVARCAEWLAGELRRIGLDAACHATPGHPVVLGEWRGAGPAAPTIVIYGHYDVQPPEPLEQWSSPPFEGTVRDGRLYARGAADDKGQVWIHLKAIEAWLATRGELPVNVVLVIEGEEEIGSPSLPGFVAGHRERLACDYIVISDTVMFAPGVPNILASMRGLAYFELTTRSAPADLHSGQYGGVVANAAGGLARVLASLQDPTGVVTIPGFYDDVRPPSPARREELARLAFDGKDFAAGIGIEALVGEPGYTPLERLWLRPTCEVNGLEGGYTGEGAKTVIPSTARAKVSFRLVPEQTPERVEKLLRDHLARLVIPGVSVALEPLHGGLPWSAGSNSPAVQAARRALATAFEHEPVIGGAGGTIPIVPELARHFDADILLVGFGLPGENAHAPNEWIAVDNVRRGMRAVASLYAELALSGRKSTPAP
jgi:acetylornithine deacetylase/succinyl-diaminopimelate desuccinylase-like protein